MKVWQLLFLCVTYLSAALSDTPLKKEETIKNDLQQLMEKKLQSFEIPNISKLFPDQHGKLNAILRQSPSDSNYAEKIALLNDYTDEYLILLNEFLMLQSVDPLPLDDMVTGFEFRFIFITYWAEISLRNGWLQGAASMVRKGDVTFRYEYPNLKVHSPLGFKKLMFTYDYLIQFMGFGPKGVVDGTVDGCEYFFDLSINLTNLRANVDKFQLTTLGKVDIKFSGYIWFDWFVNLCAKFTLIGVKPILRLVIEAFTFGLFRYLCNIFNNLICQMLDDCPENVTSLVF